VTVRVETADVHQNVTLPTRSRSGPCASMEDMALEEPLKRDEPFFDAPLLITLLVFGALVLLR
jgi:hypothetical protein